VVNSVWLSRIQPLIDKIVIDDDLACEVAPTFYYIFILFGFFVFI